METILVPTDFSPAAKNAAEYAVELAKFFDARLVLVNAFPAPSANLDTMFPVDAVTSMQHIASGNLEALKRELLLHYGDDIDIECNAEMGSVYDVVDLNSKKYEADLIVMGIIEEAGVIREHILGSSAVKVARNIGIPTFIIPEKVKYQPIKHISFACDMEKTEQTALISIVKYFSEIFKAELEIINIEGLKEEVSYEKARTSVFIEKKLESVKHQTVYIAEERIAKGLEIYFESHPTDLLITNPKKHNVFHNLFKENVTNELAFHLHLPILAIH
ncbi:MAG TPA: universal stress protein [Bacteroidia bacterium]|jgi:nucleotide-binding universal stress UspA family protein|nr:universal stress protein [Bacteroidia bacterium]